MGGLENMDSLFDRLVQKQAGQEIERAEEEGLTDATITQLNTLFQELKAKGQEFDEGRYDAYHKDGVNIPQELVILAGFMQGIALPLLATDEVKTESLGGLGVCLYANAQLFYPKGKPFAFWDSVDKCACLPSLDDDERWSRMHKCQRASIQYFYFMSIAAAWEAWHGKQPDGSVSWDGLWVGARAKTQLAYWVRLGCQKSKLVHNSAKLEQIEFELEMRKSFGLENT